MHKKHNWQRSRKVVRPTTCRTIGRFHSVKTEQTIHWESQLERDYLHLLEFDPGVIVFGEQPPQIALEWDDRERHYTPDLLVEHRDGLTVIEVKPEAKAAQPEWQRLFRKAAAYYAAEGVGYEVRTEAEIRKQPRLRNVGCLNRYRRWHVPGAAAQKILQAAVSSDNTVADLVHAVGEEDGYEFVCAMIATGHLAVDLDLPFDPSIKVSPLSGRESWQS